MREWVIYAVFMSVIFALFFRESGLVGALSGLLVSGPLYLGLGAVLAKLGLQRKSISQLRRERASTDSGSAGKGGSSSSGSTTAGSGPRPRPAPTRRTGGQRPGSRSARRR
jgi:hypothetical protein